MIPQIKIKDYSYDLPDERIAKYPLEQRDHSKLLIYKDGKVSEDIFYNIPNYIDKNSLIVFNDTKVVPARLFFKKPSGAHIEIFCLDPVDPAEYNLAFDTTDHCQWKCIVGNAKKWKNDVLNFIAPSGVMEDVQLEAHLVERDGQTAVVEFHWKGGYTFSKVLEMCGRVPIPPYLNRETEQIDKERYQTLYAKIRGSVAAPTAGLHFTSKVLDDLSNKGIEKEFVCLHVGAGTFFPVKSEEISAHPMHREPFVVKKAVLERILTVNKSVTDNNKVVVAVGTTSIRTLESLYYVGVSILEKNEPEEVSQWAPYERNYTWSTQESLQAIIDWLDKNSLDELTLATRIIIVPGFQFRIVDRLVTNFHQPHSTLLLLISAFVGGDWKTIYDYALTHDFRFLSYGDSSLLIKN